MARRRDRTGEHGGSDFVGRVEILAELDVRAGAAIGGAGSVVLLSGEPGIGKSRLAGEAARRCRNSGFEVHRGIAWDGDGAPPYWPWPQVLRSLAAATGPTLLKADVDAIGPELLRLLPDLAASASPATSGSLAAPEGDQPRLQLFDSVASFIGRAAERAPLLLVFDDLHWADVGTVMLLRYVGRECAQSRLLVIAAYRDMELDSATELGRAMSDLEVDHGTAGLPGLDESEVRMLLAHTLGPHEANRVADEVHQRSGGNPLFVRELTRLRVHGSDHRHGGAHGIPRTIRAVVDRRVSALTEPCREILGIAAVIGREFGTSLLQQTSTHPAADVLSLLDEASSSRIVVDLDDAGTRYAFVHSVVRESLYDRMALAERGDIHRRIAEVLATSHRPSWSELAHHYRRAAVVVGPERGAHFAELAGLQAMEQMAYEDAAVHFSSALQAFGGSDTRRARLWLAMGRAHAHAGRTHDALAALEQAAALARDGSDVTLLAEAALSLAGGDGFETPLFDARQIGLLEEALDAIGTNDSVLRARLLARLSVALTFQAPDDRRQQVAEEAVAMARRIGDAEAIASALGAHCDVIAGPTHARRRLADSGEMIELSVASARPGLELLARRHRLVALLEVGDVPGADVEIEAFARAAAALRQPLYSCYVPIWRAMRALMDGRLDECRELTDRAEALGTRAESENVALLARMIRHWLLIEECRYADALQVVREEIALVDGTWGQSLWAPLIAPSLLPHEASAALDRLLAEDFAEFPNDANWLGALVGWVVESCRVVGHERAASRVYEMLLPHAERFGVEGIAAICHGSVSRHLGTLAATLGRHNDAVRHFKAALVANRRAGALLLVAHTLHGYGKSLIATGDRATGESMLREATSTYRELGLPDRADDAEAAMPVACPGSPVGTNVFCREGELWTISYGATTARFKDSKGLRDIAELLARPGIEIHVLDLTIRDSVPAGVATPATNGLEVHTTGVVEPVLDARARAAYRARLEELRVELEEAEAFADLGRAERARAEMDFLASELVSASGLSGRPRGFADPVERARKAVSQRVRNAVKRIEPQIPELARHLESALRMGVLCSYTPDRRVDWTTKVGQTSFTGRGANPRRARGVRNHRNAVRDEGDDLRPPAG